MAYGTPVIFLNFPDNASHNYVLTIKLLKKHSMPESAKQLG